VAQSTTRDSLRIARDFDESDRDSDDRWEESRLPRGTRIDVQSEKDKVSVTPSRKMPFTLTVRDDITEGDRVLIPAGTRIEGEFQPAGGGTRFVAKTLVFDDGRR
jgi:hypothetical protein